MKKYTLETSGNVWSRSSKKMYQSAVDLQDDSRQPSNKLCHRRIQGRTDPAGKIDHSNSLQHDNQFEMKNLSLRSKFTARSRVRKESEKEENQYSKHLSFFNPHHQASSSSANSPFLPILVLTSTRH